MAGAVGIQLAAPVLSKIPGIGTPGGKAIVGIVIAFVGVKWLDGPTEAVVVGIGAGLLAQGVVELVLPKIAG